MRAPKKVIGNAQRLRRAMSVPEARLWNRLRSRAPGKPIFRRQHPIGPYVLDFYCARARLAIEIDGISHDMGDRPQRDIRRDAWLKKQGVTVLHGACTCSDTQRGRMMRLPTQLVRDIGWSRCAQRFSNAPFLLRSTVTIESVRQRPSDAIVCQEQVGRKESCNTCGLCRGSTRRVAFLQH